MPPALSAAIARLRTTATGFTPAQRTIAIIGVAGVILGTVALGSWLTRPTLTPLFTGLNAEDASAVVEQLQSASVPYELADGGGTVLVPDSAVYEQRLAAAAAGLPSGDSNGYTLLDDMGVTSSEFQQSVTYKRAIEGELAATIMALDGVKTASVQLAIPEESVFVAETAEPTASVFVETTGNTTLSTERVEAIVHLTSAAVSGMKPENVAVVDQSGRTLSTVGAGAAGSTDKQATEYESRVTANVQKLLDAVVGPGNATVTVSAAVDKATKERLDETFGPAEDGTPASSEQLISESRTGGLVEAGVLGTEEILAEDAGSYERTDETRNNAINKTVESTSTPAGALTRQTVAVAVNAANVEDVNVAQIRALVTSAAGIDDARGDEVTVELVQFNGVDAEAAQEALDAARAEEEAARTAELIRTAIIAVAVVAGVGIAVLVLLRRRKTAETVVTAPEEAYTPLLPETPAPVSTLVMPPLPDEEPEETEPTQVTLDRRRAELGEFARTDPARAADLIGNLIRNKQDS